MESPMSFRTIFLVLLAALPLGAHAGTLDVAATAVPHAEILEFVKPTLAAQGVELRVRVFTDYVQPNTQVSEERLDANYFQTLPYLEQFNIGKGTNLVPVVGVHIEPFGAYSRKHKALADLPEGATIALPNEVSNTGRALRLLHKAGVIVLKDPENALATLRDIASNPRDFRFRELEAATLPRVLDQVDLALINTNYALDAGLQPTRDALTIEDRNSPYVNYLVARPDNRDSADMKALAAALTSAAVKAFIECEYSGAVVPAS
jgi:D-methionine transport system substrate-binding protein